MPSSTSSPSNNLRCLRFLLSSMVGCNTKQMSTFIFHQILECSQAHPQTFHVTQRPNCGTKHLPYRNQIQQPKHGPKQHQRSNRAAKSTQNWTQRSNHGTSNQNGTMATHTSLIRIKNPRYQAPPVWEIRTPKSYRCPGKNYQARSTRSSTCRKVRIMQNTNSQPPAQSPLSHGATCFALHLLFGSLMELRVVGAAASPTTTVSWATPMRRRTDTCQFACERAWRNPKLILPGTSFNSNIKCGNNGMTPLLLQGMVFESLIVYQAESQQNGCFQGPFWMVKQNKNALSLLPLNETTHLSCLLDY